MPFHNPASWFSERSVETPPPPTEPNSHRLLGILKTDLIDYVVRPFDKVMDEPIKALIYSGTIKTISLFVALIFPFLGYAMIGGSITLIDRVIILNLREFSGAVIDGINADCIRHLMQTVLGGRRDEAAPPPPGEERRV